MVFNAIKVVRQDIEGISLVKQVSLGSGVVPFCIVRLCYSQLKRLYIVIVIVIIIIIIVIVIIIKIIKTIIVVIEIIKIIVIIKAIQND